MHVPWSEKPTILAQYKRQLLWSNAGLDGPVGSPPFRFIHNFEQLQHPGPGNGSTEVFTMPRALLAQFQQEVTWWMAMADSPPIDLYQSLVTDEGLNLDLRQERLYALKPAFGQFMASVGLPGQVQLHVPMCRLYAVQGNKGPKPVVRVVLLADATDDLKLLGSRVKGKGGPKAPVLPDWQCPEGLIFRDVPEGGLVLPRLKFEELYLLGFTVDLSSGGPFMGQDRFNGQELKHTQIRNECAVWLAVSIAVALLKNAAADIHVPSIFWEVLHMHGI